MVDPSLLPGYFWISHGFIWAYLLPTHQLDQPSRKTLTLGPILQFVIFLTARALGQIRTDDPFITSEVRYLLRHGSIFDRYREVTVWRLKWKSECTHLLLPNGYMFNIARVKSLRYICDRLRVIRFVAGLFPTVETVRFTPALEKEGLCYLPHI